MNPDETIYVLGGGAVGFPLAAYLVHAGRRAVVVRTSRDEPPGTVTVTTGSSDADRVRARVETVPLSRLDRLDGTAVVAVKSHANKAVAAELKRRGASGPIVIVQNGVGVEQPYIDAGLSPVYRCVVYITSQATSAHEFTFRTIASSPVGAIAGDASGLGACVERLNTPGFPLHVEANIQRYIWMKTTANSVFNSICPLLDIDCGIFIRDTAAAELARDIVKEIVTVTDRLGLRLTERELMDQIMHISTVANGQLISTLQDIKNGRETEIESLSLGIARIAASLQPPLHLPRTELLGRMVLTKSRQTRR